MKFSCATDSAEYHYTITDDDVTSNAYSADGNVSMKAKLNISVYATAKDYTPSDAATAELYWLDASHTTSINNVKMRGLTVSCDNGIIRISGLEGSEKVSFYTVGDMLLGTATAVDGTAQYGVSTTEQVVVAKIGKKKNKDCCEIDFVSVQADLQSA